MSMQGPPPGSPAGLMFMGPPMEGAPPGQAPPPMPIPYGSPYPGYGYPPQPQPATQPPQYNLQNNAKTTRGHPENGEIRRWRFTGKQILGLLATIILLEWFLAGAFWLFVFVKFIDAINGALDSVTSTVMTPQLFEIILRFI